MFQQRLTLLMSEIARLQTAKGSAAILAVDRGIPASEQRRSLPGLRSTPPDVEAVLSEHKRGRAALKRVAIYPRADPPKTAATQNIKT